jgi:hypothetical protein
LNEAEKAKAAAAGKSSELAEKVSGKTEDIKARAGDLKEQVTGQVAEMNEIAIAKMNETLADFNAALPLLRDAGYILEGMSIVLGIQPKIVAAFAIIGSLTDEKFDLLLAKNVERKLATYLVKSIHQAAKLQSKLDIKGMKPSNIAVELGVIPQITVKFKPAQPPGPPVGEQSEARPNLSA